MNSIANRCMGCGYVLDGMTSERCPECGRAVVPLEPIAQYRERRLELSRVFLLSLDKVIVRGAFRLGNRFESPISLALLDPEPGTVHVRSRWFSLNLAILFLLALLLVSALAVEPRSLWLVGILVTLMLVALAMLMMTFRRVEFVRFSSSQSGIALLDVGRSGPDEARFDDFVALVRRQIRETRDVASRSRESKA